MFITDFREDESEIGIKVVIVGNGAVGKSSMIQRYCRGVFTKSYKKTIGVDFLEKQMRVLSENVRLMLWDTAGQEEFDAITKSYYRGAQACVVAFSTTDRASFDAVKKWKRKVEEECGSIPMVLVQNKIDLMHQTAVSDEEVHSLTRECGMRLYQTSVKENINICNVFLHLAENYVNKVKSRSLMAAAGSAPRRQIGFSNKISSHHHHSSCNPQDYLSNPMFDTLHRRQQWRDKTIKLQRQLTKRRSLQRKLGGGGGGGSGGPGGLSIGGEGTSLCSKML